MRDGTRLAIGLSVGTTTLAAVTSDNAVRRAPTLAAGGGTITDFVDRVGDPVGILAADGSSHRAERVLAEALRQTAHEATRGGPLPELSAVTVPAHWRPSAVAALTGALARVPEWTGRPPTVLSDVAAATTALQHDPGLPTRGVIAVCDFGGSGTSITLVDAADGYRPIGATVRHPDFSGDMVDQALLTHVIDGLAGAGSVDLTSTSAIGSLWRLRTQCRIAKERLSAAAVTALPVELPEFRGDVRLTRIELDALLRAPLAELIDVLHDTLSRNGIHPVDLAAVASVGGAAAMAAVTTTLSEHLRVPVITSPRPGLIAATGSALRALRGPADDTATKMSAAMPNPGPVPAAPPVPSAEPTVLGALAWSQAPEAEPEALDGLELSEDAPLTGLSSARPAVQFEADDSAVDPPVRWYRRPLATMAASIVVLVGAVSAVGVVLVNDSGTVQVSDPTPSISTTPQPQLEPVAQPPAAAPAPVQQQPAARHRPVVATPAPVTRTQVVQRQAPQAPAPPPSEPPAPVTSTVTETVTPTPTPSPSTQEPPPSAPPPRPTRPPNPRRNPNPRRSPRRPYQTRPPRTPHPRRRPRRARIGCPPFRRSRPFPVCRR
ncbi:Hsp70 family protein [[Mycobacterium] burgundiense]|uniref:Hsp70 family protein n=1 Tax=[Mycobacterium] burgundiense TaxID=3064286 RepID=A0ABM9LML5_9MYCO|nr:Hsp70 family protein [Mycolicibacterium sp. MU0053]CAJ1501620.1 Hsp70 family protein [Mycolicibacterium sp. MU0053]